MALFMPCVVCLIVCSFITSDALNCKTGIQLGAVRRIVMSMPCMNKCMVVATGSGDTETIIYLCATDSQCNKSKDGTKTCCCSSNDCNTVSFAKICASSYTLKGFEPVVTLICSWIVITGALYYVFVN